MTVHTAEASAGHPRDLLDGVGAMVAGRPMFGIATGGIGAIAVESDGITDRQEVG